LLKVTAENAEKCGAMFIGCLILRISAILAGDKKGKCMCYGFPQSAQKNADLFLLVV
jgi:hypothetical protein